MTDPNNVVAFKSPVRPENITTLSHSGFCVWFGDKSGNINVMYKDPKSMSKPTKMKGMLYAPAPNLCVQSLLTLLDPPGVIAHWVGRKGEPGPVEFIRAGGIRNRICDEASHVVISTTRIKPKIGIVTNSIMRLYKFSGPVMYKDYEMNLAGTPECIAMNDNGFIIYTSEAYFSYSFDDIKAAPQILRKYPVTKPIVYALARDQFVVAHTDFYYVYKKGEPEPKQVNYLADQGHPNFFLVGDKNNILYVFYQKCFTRGNPVLEEGQNPMVFPEPDVVFATMAKTELAFSTPKDFKIVGSMPPPRDLAKFVTSGQMSKIDAQLKSYEKDNEMLSNVMIQIFDASFNNDPTHALEMPAKYPWVGGIDELISLFPILELKTPVTTRNVIPKSMPHPDTEFSFFPQLMAILEFQRAKYLDNNIAMKDVPIVNTTLAQIYAQAKQIEKLEDILTEGILDLQTVATFISKQRKPLGLAPAQAMIFAFQGQVEDGLLYLRQLDFKAPKNLLFAREAASIIHRLKGQPAVLKDTLDWLYKKSPELAIRGIMSIHHDVTLIKEWLSSHQLEHVLLTYFNYLTTQPNFKPDEEVINDIFREILTTLKDMDSPSFDMKRIAFTKASQDQSQQQEEVLTASRLELNEKAKRILNVYGNLIDVTAASKLLSDSLDPEIRLILYRVSEQYDQAFAMLMKGQSEPPMAKLEALCVSSPHPEHAFNALFKIVKIEDLLANNITFLERNLQYIDIVMLVKAIPTEMKVRPIQNLLKKAIGIMTEREASLRLQRAVLKSTQHDVAFHFVKVQCRNCRLEQKSTCASCGKMLGNQPIVMAPNGSIYHNNCKPPLI